MNKKKNFILGTIIFTSVVIGITCYNDYKVNHSNKTGYIIENNIEPVNLDDVFIRSNGMKK